MPKVTVNGLKLYYEIEGDGEPVVLIPGFAAGRWIWFKQTADLSRKFRVIIFDPRGVSASDKPEGPQTIGLLADDVAHLLETIGVDECAHRWRFVWWLCRAGVCAQVSVNDAEAGALLHEFWWSKSCRAGARNTAGAGFDEGTQQRRPHASESVACIHAGVRDRRRSTEVDHIVHLRATNEVPEHIYLSQLQAAMNFNAESRLAEIKSPTLVLSGDADVIVPVQNSRNLAAKIPGRTRFKL